MKRTIILSLGLAFILTAVITAAADETTSTTLGTSTTTTTSITSESTTTTTLASPEAMPAAPAAPMPLIKSDVKNKLLDDINLILDTAGNYKRDRFILSSNYSTYIKLIRDNKGKESSSTKSIWSDIYKLDKKTLPEQEAQLDKLIKELRKYVQDLN